MKRKTLPPTFDWELYNLAEDIAEANDLAKTNPIKRAELLKSWESMNGEMIEHISKSQPRK